ARACARARRTARAAGAGQHAVVGVGVGLRGEARRQPRAPPLCARGRRRRRAGPRRKCPRKRPRKCPRIAPVPGRPLREHRHGRGPVRRRGADLRRPAAAAPARRHRAVAGRRGRVVGARAVRRVLRPHRGPRHRRCQRHLHVAG
ncbi:hypothetical protein EV174_007152, partial [Coemansia sp. RSA 2320]